MKKIAIVCGSPSSEFLAPFDNKEWDIWVLGNRLNKFKDKRVTRIFEIHDDILKEGGLKYAKWLVSQNIPMVVGEKFPVTAKHVKVFPFDKAEKLIGHTYLTSSSAYMMAMAILDGATHIGVYGVDMAVDDHEYFWQRPCMDGWIHFARGRGIEVIIPEVSNVGKCDYVEGRGRGGKPDFSKAPYTQEEFLKMAQIHANKIDVLQAQIVQLQADIHTHGGAQQVYERLAKVARATEAGIKLDSLTNSFSTK
jgi:hypothetical protein